jgi:hypothetical protein
MEILQNGQEIVPKEIVVDKPTLERLAAVEQGDPVRAAAKNVQILGEFRKRLEQMIFREDASRQDLVKLNLVSKDHNFTNFVKGSERELAILRMTTIADLTSQQYKRDRINNNAVTSIVNPTYVDAKTSMGFSSFKFAKGNGQFGRANYPLPQLNTVQYYIAQDDGGFQKVVTTYVEREKSIQKDSESNPLVKHFQMKK